MNMSLKKLFFAVTLVTVAWACGVQAQTTGFASRYWDSCRPSCAHSNGCVACGIDGKTVVDGKTPNKCIENGTSYVCMYQGPWQSPTDPNLSYGFVARHVNGDCQKCYEWEFVGYNVNKSYSNASPSALVGKKMIVMVSNIGAPGELHQDQFDLMFPGGGRGRHDALSSQLAHYQVSNPPMGDVWGGFITDCNYGTNKECVRNNCNAAFGKAGLEDMLAACLWSIDWFQAADNPSFTYKQVDCPQELSKRYSGEIRTYGGSGSSIIVPPQTTKFTLTVATPTGGTVARTVNGQTTNNPNGATSYDSATTIRLVATASNNYTFTRWEAVSGSLPSGVTATNADISFSIRANVNIRAVFTANQVTSTYSVEVSRNLTDGGNVTVTPGGGSAQQNPNNRVTVNVGTNVTVAATTNDGYTFTGWTSVTGIAPSGVNLSNASISFSLTANQSVHIRANWTKNSTDVNKHTLSISRVPSVTGNAVSLNGEPTSSQTTYSLDKDASVMLQASAASNYEFTHWDGLPNGVTNTENPVTFTISSDMSVVANYKLKDVVCTENCGGGGEKDTIKIEAESFSSKAGDCNAYHPDGSSSLTIEKDDNASGGYVIGYICNGNKATYDVSVPISGSYTMAFNVTSAEDGAFTVFVNNHEVGQVTANTGGWGSFTNKTISSDAYLIEGNNTIRLEFSSAINVDYFLLISDKPTAVRYNAMRSNKSTKSQIILRPASGGFIAGLPANHKFTTYRVIDMQGREIKRGKVGAGASDLKVSGVKSGVVFLRLEGPGVKPQVLRATATR